MQPADHQLLAQIASLAQKNNQLLTTAESCTGGLISAAMTELSGSSAWFDRGFVTYSNEAKMQMLGVSASTLETHGAVSEQAVAEMAGGALSASNASLAISVSGVAGPTGGSDAKPVGTVYIGFAATGRKAGGTRHHFSGDRLSVRAQTVTQALKCALTMLKATV